MAINNKRFIGDNKPDDEVEVNEEIENLEELGITGDVNDAPNNLLYNVGGFEPVSVTYRLTPSVMKEQFLKIVQAAITDVVKIGMHSYPDTGEVLVYAVFKDNSSHFINKHMENTMINIGQTEYYSPEFKKFAANFGIVPKRDCPRDKNGNFVGRYAELAKRKSKGSNGKQTIPIKDMLVKTETNGVAARNKCLVLSWTKLASALFDEFDRGFENKYKQRPSRSKITAHFCFGKANNMPYGRLECLEVTKEHATARSRDLTPKFAFGGIEV